VLAFDGVEALPKLTSRDLHPDKIRKSHLCKDRVLRRSPAEHLIE
jgi:hypothetical protein